MRLIPLLVKTEGTGKYNPRTQVDTGMIDRISFNTISTICVAVNAIAHFV